MTKRSKTITERTKIFYTRPKSSAEASLKTKLFAPLLGSHAFLKLMWQMHAFQYISRFAKVIVRVLYIFLFIQYWIFKTVLLFTSKLMWTTCVCSNRSVNVLEIVFYFCVAFRFYIFFFSCLFVLRWEVLYSDFSNRE